jgi:hypothetical protein
MTIDLSIKDTQRIERLGKQLDNGIVHTKAVREFLSDMDRKVRQASGPSSEKKNDKKIDRKDKYRMKLKLR